MWISDDTTQNLTAQWHQLSNDVMLLSSLGESQLYMGGKNEIMLTLLFQDFTSVL